MQNPMIIIISTRNQISMIYSQRRILLLTVFRSIEFNIELLHAVIDHLHLVVTHHPKLSHQSAKISNQITKQNPSSKSRINRFDNKNLKKLQFHQIHFSTLARRRHGFSLLLFCWIFFFFRESSGEKRRKWENLLILLFLLQISMMMMMMMWDVPN